MDIISIMASINVLIKVWKLYLSINSKFYTDCEFKDLL